MLAIGLVCMRSGTALIKNAFTNRFTIASSCFVGRKVKNLDEELRKVAIVSQWSSYNEPSSDIVSRHRYKRFLCVPFQDHLTTRYIMESHVAPTRVTEKWKPDQNSLLLCSLE